MKHLLRKLHIGGINGQHRPVDPIATTSPSSSTSIAAVDSDRTVGGDAGPNSGGGEVDFNLLEEEFQVQLALAISASDPDSESAQIDAAKRISLGCPASADGADSASSMVDSLSLRYWSYNVVNYNEKVLDGFYDVHCTSTNTVIEGKMPSLVDLQALSIVDNVDYEVILVNRFVDPKLRELEKSAFIMSLESPFSNGLVLSGLVQKIADVVVDRMGGPVGDADEMSLRWKRRRSELRGSQNSIILPLGCLDIGLSRHRALLFKVLADRINLPCMLVKGSYYTGTDDGAVNLIRIEDDSEYIIDLMGAPGTLIPVEVPSSHILNAGFTVRGFAGLPDITDCSCLIPVEGPEALAIQTELDSCPVVAIPKSEETLVAHFATNRAIGEELLQCHSDKFIVKGPGQHIASLTSEDSSVKTTYDHGQEYSLELSAEQRREIPMLSDNSNERFVLVHNRADKRSLLDATDVDMIPLETPGVLGRAVNDRQIGDSLFLSTMDTSCLPHEQTLACDDEQHHQNEMGTISDTKEAQISMTKLTEPKVTTPVLGEGADWEILWDDLQIGERIGIGSYGEVYHAELNGTEVAVKKFLDQDFSRDALFQIKCEIEIMLRLRHPNVVLFMGAVTRPPHLSILTEFLPRGSLYKLLHRPNTPIDEKRRMRMAIDVAKGMNYLHTSHPTIVHRDLKSPNLLVDKNWVVKVCDFGLSRLKHHTFLSSKSTAGTPEWMAPEVLRNEPANEKCDVYSFGVILWELATCQIPWKDLNPMQVVGAVGFQNRRLEIPESVDPTVAQIIQDCWQMEPRLRPSFSQLISRLRQVQRLRFQRTNLTEQTTQ